LENQVQVFGKPSAGFWKTKCKFLENQVQVFKGSSAAVYFPAAHRRCARRFGGGFLLGGEFDPAQGAGHVRFQRPASLFTTLIFSAGFPKLLEIAREM
jgi:hypothetical protein